MFRLVSPHCKGWLLVDNRISITKSFSSRRVSSSGVPPNVAPATALFAFAATYRLGSPLRLGITGSRLVSPASMYSRVFVLLRLRLRLIRPNDRCVKLLRRGCPLSIVVRVEPRVRFKIRSKGFPIARPLINRGKNAFPVRA